MLSVGKILALAAIMSGGLAGCASIPDPGNWTATAQVDPFTDARLCRVEQRVRGASWRQLISFVPYIERRDDGIRVGLRSPNAYGGVPTGDVRIRIDDNPAWTITTAETPIDKQPAGITPYMGTASAASPGTGGSTAADAAQQVYGSIGKMISPFTAATGDKAEAMLAQMKEGSMLIYETTGFNQPGSSTGRIALDDEFRAALTKCAL